MSFYLSWHPWLQNSANGGVNEAGVGGSSFYGGKAGGEPAHRPGVLLVSKHKLAASPCPYPKFIASGRRHSTLPQKHLACRLAIGLSALCTLCLALHQLLWCLQTALLRTALSSRALTAAMSMSKTVMPPALRL